LELITLSSSASRVRVLRVGTAIPNGLPTALAGGHANSAVLQFLDPVLKRGYERGGLALRLRHFETALEDMEDETDFLLVQHL
jgi:hypothetical protein